MTRSLQFFRFAAVGTVSTVVHTIVAWTSIALLGLSTVAANTLGFFVATGFSFIANTLWSFSSRPQKRRLATYLAVALTCLLVTILSSFLAQNMELSPIAGIALVVITSTPLGFFLHRRYTYAASEMSFLTLTDD